jgi:hypothetical protein
VESSEPFVGVPETPEEQLSLLASRPVGWEYQLFAGILKQGKTRLEFRWRDSKLGICRAEKRPIDRAQAMERLSASFGRLGDVCERLANGVFDEAVQEEIFGVRGEPGDPTAIEHFARHVVSGYEDMLDWTDDLRSVRPPEHLQHAFDLASRAAQKPMLDVREFMDAAQDAVDQIQAHVAEDNDAPLRITLSLTLTTDDQLMSEFAAEPKRLTDGASS